MERVLERCAGLARGKLRKKLPALRQALVGRFRAQHAFLVSQLLAHLDDLDEAIETVSTQIDTAMAPFAEELARLDTIRGVNKRTAEVVIADLGVDMTVFPSAKHAASWSGLCPGNHESAGKHRSGRTRHGENRLATDRARGTPGPGGGRPKAAVTAVATAGGRGGDGRLRGEAPSRPGHPPGFPSIPLT